MFLSSDALSPLTVHRIDLKQKSSNIPIDWRDTVSSFMAYRVIVQLAVFSSTGRMRREKNKRGKGAGESIQLLQPSYS